MYAARYLGIVIPTKGLSEAIGCFIRLWYVWGIVGYSPRSFRCTLCILVQSALSQKRKSMLVHTVKYTNAE